MDIKNETVPNFKTFIWFVDSPHTETIASEIPVYHGVQESAQFIQAWPWREHTCSEQEKEACVRGGYQSLRGNTGMEFS